MERDFNINNRDFFDNKSVDETRTLYSTRGRGFFSDLTKKLVSSAGEKAASAIGSKAGEALGNKLFAKKNKSKESTKIEAAQKQPNENKGNELMKILKQKSEQRSQSENNKQPISNIHEIYNRLLEDSL